jgi:hypothetical protein
MDSLSLTVDRSSSCLAITSIVGKAIRSNNKVTGLDAMFVNRVWLIYYDGLEQLSVNICSTVYIVIIYTSFGRYRSFQRGTWKQVAAN